MQRPTLRTALLLSLPLLLLPLACAAQVSVVQSFPAKLASLWLAGAPGWLSAMLMMMAITTGVLALLHRRERRVFFLGGMMICWVLLQAENGFERPALQLLTLGVLVLCGVQFLLRTVLWSRLWLDIALMAQCVLAPLSLQLVAPESMQRLVTTWYALLTVELLAAFALHLSERRRSLRAVMPMDPVELIDFRLMTALMGCVGPLLLLRLILSLVAPPDVIIAWLPWLDLVLPLLMLGLGLHVVIVFARAAADADARHAMLELRMHEKVADAERNFHAMAELRLEQVTERERKRIAADLHDDLGAKLLTIVHTSESDRISSLAREALEEMRLSVRGLTGKPVQLLDALGDWRAELVSRLAQANIQAEWKSPPEDIVHTLPARAYVQTTRIFREAVSNIIKHSGATHCTIGCQVQDGDFLVVIQDDGQGIPSELDGRLDRGHGMASMKSRAKQLHGQCLVESGPGWGTVIRLTIPL
ncbi:ATP-binding protein [Paucibacter sp. R3-3]|uniref:histidine kinase n=1 Tax=Roseateles agri TaxID=3098619 RepID=A0ABU5DQF3_9BURK|nr:ATP-binding protein [Paucibacter sp. R3-3]MDY0748553.1 ATP-binding protein [Paucibacter sp. R3-3]